ncbi:urease accessory protein UreD [Actinospica sp. MGRD01-02]|uniref:Urease accessory protein UreD n=1 Tax=Actinospica acidithermotolerans TaxID=2828514 RepID=A0A941INJ9_9ACTN|nr:urease accessory protein UreD [Actinospica acidithermotolerans]MBR7829571.1 urease accessory protein UreD [Actinospica acidithermotolerans]
MKARARIVARAEQDGTTSLTTLAGETPLLLRRAAHPDGLDTARIHLMGGTAGPIGGDDLAYRVEIGEGAKVQVRSMAATLALPGPGGAQSTLAFDVRVGSGARLDWAPEPLIAARGANHAVLASLDLAEDAELTWREDVVLGRDDEGPGSVRSRTRITRAGRVVFDHEFAVGPRYPGSLGPAGTAGYRRVTLTVEFTKGEHRPTIKLAFSGADLPDLSHTFT